MVEQYLARHPDMGRQITILYQREGKFTDALVPISLIYREDVPVEEVHVAELAASMRHEGGVKRSGQLSPVLLACVPDFSQLPILDGFHRVEALDRNGRTEVFSTIRPTSSWEEVTDLRILTAETHRSIRFARLVEWVEAAWNRSQWADRVRVNQAFALRYSASMTGERIGINADEVLEIREWVDRKCEQWHMKPGSVYQHLLTAQSAAPGLIKEARERSGGSSLEAITPQHLKEISLTLPYKHDMQRAVARTATAQRLTVRMTKALAVAVARARNENEAQEIIEAGRWRADVRTVTTHRLHKRPVKIPEVQTEPKIDKDLLEKFFQDELKIAELTIENAQLSGRYIPYERILKRDLPQPVAAIENNELTLKDVELQETPQIKLTDEQVDAVITRLYEAQSHVQTFLHGKFGTNRDEAEDIFSDVMLRTISSIKRGKFQFMGDAGLESWAIKVARNLAIDRYRATEKRARIRSLDEPGVGGTQSLIETLENEHPDSDFLEAEREYQEIIKTCLPHLAETQRRTFVLRTFFNLSYVDIMQVLGITHNNARIRVFRAKEEITQLITSGKLA